MSQQSNQPLSERESDIYNGWEKSGAFASDLHSSAEPYTIMIPPPNVTGSLHIGHALTMTIQDTLVRWNRMKGKDTLWQPGTDHAGIATQMMVERELAKQGLSKNDLSREDFIKRVWQWKAESGGNITQQLRRLGASLDWDRERFTLDDDFSASVNHTFVTLFNQGLIYRAKRLVNWDQKLQSAISDLEVKHQETQGSLWYIKYPISEVPGSFITIATTRPETMLGDVAIAVNPADERYIKLIGMNAIIPLIGKIIPIIADEHSDMEKGTGAVKISPGHDFDDFEVAQNHNLPMVSIFDTKACIVLEEIKESFQELPGITNLKLIQQLEGKDSLTARQIILEELERVGLFEKSEPHVMQVPYAERGGAVVEPFLTTQWFCNAAELAKEAIKAVKDGDIKFVPKNWENNFFSWMDNIEPWCISRQLWWGHQIPAWYGPDGKVFVDYSYERAVQAAKSFYKNEEVVLTRDEDVLDTWFSSALWPFATLGWPHSTEDLERYYPTNDLVTGFDIIFFWVARMIMMGLHLTGKVPFKTVFIHGLILDEHGQKMSKTKGNVINPLELMEDYGADTLRWSMCALTGPGRNLKLSAARIETSRTFMTKINNAVAFWKRYNIALNPVFDSGKVKNILCKWLLIKMNQTISLVNNALEAYRFDDYTEALYHFIWHIFCDWFIELAKPILASDDAIEVKETAAFVLNNILRLLHPSIPFLTEELCEQLDFGVKGSLIKASWPISTDITNIESTLKEMDWVVDFITSVRAARAEMKIAPNVSLKILLQETSSQSLEWALKWKKSLLQLTRSSEITELSTSFPFKGAQVIIENATLILQFDIGEDNSGEYKRLEKEISNAKVQLEKLMAQLENKEFINKAPQKVIEERHQQLESVKAEINRLTKALAQII
jgi:valyl-tRNA synthetase